MDRDMVILHADDFGHHIELCKQISGGELGSIFRVK